MKDYRQEFNIYGTKRKINKLIKKYLMEFYNKIFKELNYPLCTAEM